MRNRVLALVVVAASALGTPVAASTAAPSQQSVVAAKSCSSGYTHAVIGGKQKCLRAGEFCAHRYDSQYRHYGYRCTRYYRNVHRYRLTHS